MEKKISAQKLIQLYKMRKSAAIAGSVVLSCAGIDALFPGKTNKVLNLTAKFAVGTAAAYFTGKAVDASYTVMNDYSIKSKEKKSKEAEECPDEFIEFDTDDLEEELNKLEENSESAETTEDM